MAFEAIQMHKLFINYYYFLLFSPLFAYVYSVVLKLPKTINQLYVFLAFCLGIVFFVNTKIVRDKKIIFPNYLWFMMAYAIYRLVWQFIALEDKHPLTFIYYAILNFSILFIITIIYNINFQTIYIQKSVSILKVIVVVSAVVSIIQVFDSSFLYQKNLGLAERVDMMYQIRRTSIFSSADPNELGLSFLPMVSVLVGYLLLNKDRSYLFFLPLIGLVAFLSNTRYIMVGFLIITFQYLVFRKFRLKNILGYSLLAALLTLTIVFSLKYMGYDMQKWYKERLFAEGHVSETTRYKAFSNFSRFFPQHMFVGTGVHLTEEIRKASHKISSSQIHVGYLSHLVSYGLIGSVLLFGFWFCLAKRLYQTARRTNYWGSFFAFCIYFWAQATFVNYSLFFPGLLIALVFDCHFHNSHQAKERPIIKD